MNESAIVGPVVGIGAAAVGAIHPAPATDTSQ
jgi:hypothetical protein